MKPPPVASPEPAPPEPGAPDPLAYRDRGLFPTASTCLYQLLKAEGDSTASLTQIRRTLRGDLQGISLGHLRSYLEQSGIAATVRRQPSADLLASGRPAIVLVRTKHTEQDPLSGQFVLCTGPAAEGVRIVDPLAGIRVLPVETFAGRYLGVSLRLDAPRNLPAREAPDLWCEEMVWSFEEVPSGAEIRHSFEITNRGDRPLKIERVETTCGCAAAMVGGKGELAADLIAGAKPEKETDPKKLVAQKDSGGVIEPGKSAWVSAYVNTLYKQGFMSFQLRLITNDPEEHESLLSLQGTVVRVFEWDPVTLWFPDVNATTGAFGYLWVRHHRSRAFRVTDIRSTSKHVAAWVEENAPREPPAGTQAAANPAMPPRSYPAEQGWVGLKVMVLPDAPIGTLSATLSLKAEDTPIEASVAALVKGNLVVEPAYFSFGHLHKGEAQSVSVTLRSALGEVLEVKSVTASKDFMRAAVQEGGAGTYRITLSLTEGWSDPDLQGVVTICTNDPLEPEKKVLVYGFIRR
ncbi:MAG: DUF1573 domain-containing protein [Planctomycetes bacterium]|nr:DUF1573 domain-containing protein [Planctomycetota bacterium]